jgi:hypothetical protein
MEGPELKGLTISISSRRKSHNTDNSNNKEYKYNLKELLKDQIEINKDYIGFFYGCWIKCVERKTHKYIPGGFLTKVSVDDVFVELRPVNNPENIKVYLKNYTFYVKRDTEQYIGMQKIILEKEKIKYERDLFNLEKCNLKLEIKKNSSLKKRLIETDTRLKNERYAFDNLSYNFYKMFRNGKAKILA